MKKSKLNGDIIYAILLCAFALTGFVCSIIEHTVGLYFLIFAVWTKFEFDKDDK